MIVCNICGDAVSDLGVRCPTCSGKGIEKATPMKSLLTPTQRKGSPDRWARRYTTPPGRASGSPLAGAHQSHPPSSFLAHSPKKSSHVDLRLVPEAELARVCGTVFNTPNVYPRCASCLEPIQLGGRLYIAPMDKGDIRVSDSTCRACYSKLFAIGTCAACAKPIVGDREEGHCGAHVKGRGTSMWHASCFRCSFCQGQLYRQEHLLTPSGEPACPPCFDKSLDQPPTQSPTIAGSAKNRRSYSRPRSLPAASGVTSPIPANASPAPRWSRKPVLEVPTTPISNKRIGDIGSVRELTARFDVNKPIGARQVHGMKQSINELDRHLEKASG